MWWYVLFFIFLFFIIHSFNELWKRKKDRVIGIIFLGESNSNFLFNFHFFQFFF
jgi:hypothetical protein